MDDVLERMTRFLSPGSPMYRSEGRQIMEALAAEVRALRKDRERLDWLETCQSITTGRENGYDVIGPTRIQLDAAMASRGEDA